MANKKTKLNKIKKQKYFIINSTAQQRFISVIAYLHSVIFRSETEKSKCCRYCGINQLFYNVFAFLILFKYCVHSFVVFK